MSDLWYSLTNVHAILNFILNLGIIKPLNLLNLVFESKIKINSGNFKFLNSYVFIDSMMTMCN